MNDFRITAPMHDWLRLLDMLEYFIKPRSNIPALECFVLSIADENVWAEATDLDRYIRARFDCEHTGEVRLAIPFTALRNLARACEKRLDLTLSIESHEGDVAARVGRGIYVFGNTNLGALEGATGNFLERLRQPSWTMHAIDDDTTFREALRKCLKAVSVEETRYYLNGVCLWDDLCVATDGHRLHVWESGLPKAATERHAIIPHDTVKAIISAAGLLSIGFDGAYMRLDWGDRQVVSKLIDGVYPDWPRVVAGEQPKRIDVNRLDLLDLLERFGDLGNHPAVMVGFNGTGRVILARESADGFASATDVAQSGLSALEPGEPSLIAFNARLLKQAIASMSGFDRVEIAIGDAGSPAHLRGVRPDRRERPDAILMPMRTGEKLETLAKEALRWER